MYMLLLFTALEATLNVTADKSDILPNFPTSEGGISDLSRPVNMSLHNAL